MNNKNNPLVADSSANTLRHISEALTELKNTIGRGSTKEHAANIEFIKRAVDYEMERCEDSSAPDNPLIRDDTADTLGAVKATLSALDGFFNHALGSDLSSSRERCQWTGWVYILSMVMDALEHEIEQNGGADEVEGEDDE